MSIHLVKHAAKLAGLSGASRLLGAPIGDFILLDKDTDGRTGRPIFINQALLEKFAHIDNFSDIQYAFQQIKQLRALAGGITCYTNPSNPMEHMYVVGRAKITYKVLTSTGEPGRKPGVFITDMDVADFSNHEPGIYRVTKSRDQWSPDKKVQTSLSSPVAAINGLCEGMNDAASDIIPNILESAYGTQSGYDLFYNPPTLFSEGKEWKTPQQKMRGDVITRLLAQALVNSQRNGKEVKWVVHGDGATLLHKTLKRLGNTDLSKHTLMFMAPLEVVADILPLARKLKMNLHDDVMKIHDHDLASKQLQWGLGNLKKLNHELNKFGMDDQAYLLTKKLNRDRVALQKSLNSFGWTVFNLTTMLLAPAAIAMGPSKIARKVANTVLSGMTAVDSAEKYRNHIATSSKIKNPAYNPHLNPHKSVDQLNLAAKKASGSVEKTFVDVLKARIKG